MPLVTSKEMLIHATENHYAVGAFNANNMEQMQAIVEAAEEERAPVILQVAPDAIRYAGVELIATMGRSIAMLAGVPVVLHLDHGIDFQQNVRCLHLGFTSLMYDGSKKTFEDNVRITRQVGKVAHAVGIPVEAELGSVLRASDNVTPEEVCGAMTDPDQAAEFVRRTEVDSLAVAVGSVHGMRSRNARLDLARIDEIYQATDVPLVLHGSSGVLHDDVVEAIGRGVAKINVGTYLYQAFMRGLRRAMHEMPDNVYPRRFLAVSREEVKEAVREKIRLFRSSGMASTSGGLTSEAQRVSSVDLTATEE